MLKLIVFDCDGVMFDSLESNIRYYNDALALFGYPPMSETEVKYAHMATNEGAIEHIFRNYKEGLEEVQKRATTELNYNDYRKYMKMEPDLLQFLEVTSQRYKLAVSTNRGESMVPLLQEHNLEHYFNEVMTSCTAPKPKPAPDGLKIILEKLKTTSSETLFIGDSMMDKMQAEACGVALAAFKNAELDADYHVSSFMEILDLPLLQKK